MPWPKEYRKMNRETINAVRRAKHAENPEIQKAYRKKWRSEHPELVKAQLARAKATRMAKYPEQREAVQARLRKWRADNPQLLREYQQKAYLKHREKRLAYVKQYYKENPHVTLAAATKRRLVKRGATLGDVSLITQWQKAIRAKRWVRCHWCGTKVSGEKVQFDHVIPLAKGGKHSIDNLCTSCAECNQHKHARLISDWLVGGQSFLNL